jgi:hypothetical protein
MPAQWAPGTKVLGRMNLLHRVVGKQRELRISDQLALLSASTRAIRQYVRWIFQSVTMWDISFAARP